jgi:hypothetical protein
MTLTFTPPTARAVPEWIGANADTPVPPRVRVRVFDRKHGRCHICERSIRAGEKWTLEHLIALINWRATTEQPHGNRESNLTVTCDWCLPEKNAADVAQKSKAYATRAKHLGIKQPGRLSSSRYRKTMAGTVIDKTTGQPVNLRRKR